MDVPNLVLQSWNLDRILPLRTLRTVVLTWQSHHHRLAMTFFPYGCSSWLKRPVVSAAVCLLWELLTGWVISYSVVQVWAGWGWEWGEGVEHRINLATATKRIGIILRINRFSLAGKAPQSIYTGPTGRGQRQTQRGGTASTGRHNTMSEGRRQTLQRKFRIRTIGFTSVSQQTVEPRLQLGIWDRSLGSEKWVIKNKEGTDE